MPWCTGCDRFLSPSTVTPTGECPRCGAAVDPGGARAATPEGSPPAVPDRGQPAEGVGTAPTGAPPAEPTTDDDTPLPIPWHFKLLVGAIALYLGWRAFQGVEWLLRRL